MSKITSIVCDCCKQKITDAESAYQLTRTESIGALDFCGLGCIRKWVSTESGRRQVHCVDSLTLSESQRIAAAVIKRGIFGYCSIAKDSPLPAKLHTTFRSAPYVIRSLGEIALAYLCHNFEGHWVVNLAAFAAKGKHGISRTVRAKG